MNPPEKYTPFSRWSFIFAGVFYTLAILFFFSDKIIFWGKSLQNQYAEGPLLIFGDFVVGVGITAFSGRMWAIPCLALGVLFTGAALWLYRTGK